MGRARQVWAPAEGATVIAVAWLEMKATLAAESNTIAIITQTDPTFLGKYTNADHSIRR